MPKDSEEQEINDEPSTELLEVTSSAGAYAVVLSQVVELMEAAHRAAARSINTIMTATYWEIGRRIVELEQKGESRAEYGKQIIERLAKDLSERFGRGFQKSNLFQMRAFYLTYSQVVQPFLPENVSQPDFPNTVWKIPLTLVSLREAALRQIA